MRHGQPGWLVIRFVSSAAEDAQDFEEGEEGVEKMVISKCYHKVVVSSNPKTVDK